MCVCVCVCVCVYIWKNKFDLFYRFLKVATTTRKMSTWY